MQDARPAVATARCETPAAARYLGQLCKHFAHKITVAYDPETDPHVGVAQFPWGTCALRADADALIIEAEADRPEDLARIQAVVDDHLRRFAWRETLDLEWR